MIVIKTKTPIAGRSQRINGLKLKNKYTTPTIEALLI